MKPNLCRQKLLTIFTLYALMFSALGVRAQKTRELTQEDDKKAPSQKRVALVIGNGAYTKAKPLANPSNDAADMAKTLQELGFEVISGVNQNKRQMETLIREFGTKLASSGGVGLFYYAGHGLQVGGENFLVPVDADIPEEDEVAYSAVSINLVLSKMQTAKNDLNIIILDACRNNPFARSWRSFRDNSNNEGLAKISPPTGTLVLYATEPGKVASDGSGRNGLFTEALIKQLKQPNMEYDQMVRAISADVWQKSNKQQLPWKEGNSLKGFYFSGKVPNLTGNKIPQPEIQPVEKLPSSDELLSDYAKAIGFDKGLSITTLFMKGTVEGTYNGQKFTGQTESYLKKPGKYLVVNKFTNGNLSKDVYDGERGWVYGSTTGTKEKPQQQLDFFKRNMAVSNGDIETMKKYYTKMAVKGRERVDEKEALILELETLDGKIERMYFEASTKLPFRWDFGYSSSATQQGITFSTELYIEDYIDINGFKVPLTARQKTATMTFITRYDAVSLRYNEPLDDKLFKKP